MQTIRVVLTAIFLGLFGLVGPFVNYSAPASARVDIKTENQPNMSHSISTLLSRNLNDVSGENELVRRRAAIDELFTEDSVFYDPTKGVYRGRAEIDRIAGEIRVNHRDFRYQPIAEPEAVGNGGRVRWVEGRPGETPALAGTDFIIARDGRIGAVYLFFDKLPYTPLNAALCVSGWSRSPLTTSSASWPCFSGSRVRARTLNSPLACSARTTPLPCCPVAPNTAITFLSVSPICCLPLYHYLLMPSILTLIYYSGHRLRKGAK